MRTWLRTNRIALATIPLCLGLLAVLLVALPLADRREEAATTVPVGKERVLDGVRYGVVAAAGFGADQGIRLPADAALTAAVLTATPVGRSVGTCTFALIGAIGGTRRTWTPEADVSRYGYGRGEGYESSCVRGPAEPYRAEVVFLTPADVLPTAMLEVRSVRSGATRDDVLRFQLPPPRTAS